MKRLLVGVLCTLVLASAAQTKQPVTVTDMLKIKSIGNCTLTRDGLKAAFTVTSIEPDEDSKLDYKYVTQIWMVPTDGTTPPRQLTSKENSSQPAFSPDGKQLAFVRVADNKPQLFLLSLDGGEAIQLTKFKYGASAPKWSPDGKQLLFAANIPMHELMKDSALNAGLQSPVWPYEKPGFSKNEQFKAGATKANPDGSLEEVRAYLDNNVADKKARVIDKLAFQDEMNINADLSFTHFFIIDVPRERGGVADTPIPVTKGFYSFSSADFTPDGKQLVFSADIDSTEHPDRSLENGIYMANRDGSHLRTLLAEKGKVYSGYKISPTGKWLAVQYGDTTYVKLPQLGIMPMSGSAKDMMTIPFDRAKGNFVWSADEKYLYFNSASNGGVPLYRLNMQTKQVEQLTDYNSGISNFDVMNNKLVFVKTEVANPFELYLADASAKNAKRISSFNYNWVQR